ncbi:MAG: DUF4199 domain-containing protein [Bacteroidota bacterium]
MLEEVTLPSKWRIGLKYALIYAVIAIAASFVIDRTDQTMSTVSGLVQLVIFCAFVILAYRDYKQQGDGFMDFGEGFKIGMNMALTYLAVTVPFTYLFFTVINPDEIQRMKEAQIMQLEEQGMSDREIDTAMGISEMFMTPGAITIMAIVLGLIFSLIAVLILSAIAKKARPEPI